MRTIMKRKIVISMLVAVSMAAAYGQSQSHFSTSTNAPEVTLPRPSPAPRAPVNLAPIEGVVQAAIRHGNPVQMLNPAAPAEYGNARDHVTYDPNDPGKPKGIALFAWTF
jgi:hypothetical protein